VPSTTEGSAEGVNTSGVGDTRIAVAADVVWAELLLSVTVAVRAEVPLIEGTPEMTPVDAARPSPTGSLPEVIDQM
jgi:hypothetical protein